MVAQYAFNNGGNGFKPCLPQMKNPFMKTSASVTGNALIMGNTFSGNGDGVLESTDVYDFLATDFACGNTARTVRMSAEIFGNLTVDQVVSRVIVIDNKNIDGNGHRGFHVYVDSCNDYYNDRVSEHGSMYNILVELHDKYPGGYHRVSWHDNSYTHEMRIDPQGRITDCNCPPDLYFN